MIRRYSLLGLLAISNFATVELGKYLGGEGTKLAVSNVTPVLFLAVALPSFYLFHKSFDKKMVGFLLFFNAFAAVSFLIFAFRFNWVPNLPVLFFQEIEIVFSIMLIWYGRRNPEEFSAVVRYGTICSALVSAWFGFQQAKVGGWLLLTFAMDDKSQAAVMFCCQAFILLRYFGGMLDISVAGILMIMSFMTISRLPVFFIPVIFVALARRSGFIAGVIAIAGCAGLVVLLSAGDSINQLFKVLDRLSSIETVASDSATSAHFLLIESALKMKFTDVYAFFAGTGPGNFSKALISFPISKDELEAIDPALIGEARLNRAPMHSTPASALLDYSLVIFCLLGYLLIKAFRYLYLNRCYIEIAFFVTLFGASMFYSLHNKPYLFLLCSTIAVLMMEGKSASSKSTYALDHATMQKVIKI